ncbi:MAG: MFS transporter [Deltaproteobacteria bacterium]|nr:MFS transporter [Deltaproteobacteria bacterium]MBW2419755.1 MFS transporter [Deltaproteobacteria bacterium]
MAPAPIIPTLSIIWGLVLAGLGLIFPFYALYLRENAGLTGTEVGLVAATLPLMGVLVQPMWGQVADRTGLRGRVLAVLALGTAAGYALLSRAQSFEDFLLYTALLALFSTATIPACMSVSLALLPEPSSQAFGRVRVVGTLGFGVSVGAFPFLLRALRDAGFVASKSEASSGEPGLHVMFYVAGVLLLLASLASLALPRRGAVSLRASQGEWRTLLSNRLFVRLLIYAFFAYLSMQGPMVLFPILVRAQGGGLEAVSQMWLIMLVLEVPLVFYFGAGVARMGPRGVIAIGMAAGALRWGVSGFAEDLRWVYLAQALHGVTVWGIILGAPVYVDAVVPARLRSTAQGLLAMVGVSLGSILSNVGAGWLTDAVGPRAPAQLAGLMGLALTLVLPWMLPPAERPAEAEGSEDAR